jgi:hypothetical protein
MITAIQPTTQKTDLDRLPTDATLGVIHTAQIKETLSALHNYKEGDLLKNLLPEGTKVRSTGETSKNHAAYMSGFMELIESLTDNTADFMKINGDLQSTACQAVNLLQEANTTIAKQTNDSLSEYANEMADQKKNQNTMQIFGWVMAALMSVVSFGTMSVAAAAVATVVAVGAQVVNSVKTSDGKTLMEKLATALGGGDAGNTKATLLMDAIVLIATVGVGVGEAMAQNATETAENAATTAAQTAARNTARVGINAGAEAGAGAGAGAGGESGAAGASVEGGLGGAAGAVGRNVAEDTAEGSFKKLIDKMKAALAELKEKAMEFVGKRGSENLSSEADNTRDLQSFRETMRSALGAVEKLGGEVFMKGVGNGVKLGVQEIMTHFNPIAPIVSDAYYHANVRDNMSDQEKAALRSKGDLIGECVGAAASFAYIGAACKYPNISGTNAFAKAGSSATQLLLQKVATGLMALGNAGQMVIAALLCDILRKASATQEHVATLRAESTKMQYAIDTMADTRRKISDESAQNATDLFGMLNMLMAASKKCFVIR